MTVLAVGGQHSVPEPDAIAAEYLLLALRLDQHVPGLVDGYYGPRDLKAQVDSEPLRPPASLAGDAAALRQRVAAEVPDAGRARWLDRQVLALETQALVRAGTEIGYLDEVRRCFDAEPVAISRETYAEVRAELERVLPGQGDLHMRLDAWDRRFVISPDLVKDVVDWLMPRIREAAAARFPIPDGESLRVALVRNQPWSGYNWYDGALRSRVDINVDLPIRPYDLIATLTHETFPGHHLEHAWKEARLLTEQRRVEASILLINTPECYVSEGLAELGRRYTLDDDVWLTLLLGAYGVAGLRWGHDDAVRQLAIGAALHRIRGAGGDAALMLHAEGRPRDEVLRFLEDEALMTPERAAKRLEFVEHPLWRTYVFSYAGGEELLGSWCDAAGPDDDGPRGRFLRLLTEQLTPSGLAADLGRA